MLSNQNSCYIKENINTVVIYFERALDVLCYIFDDIRLWLEYHKHLFTCSTDASPGKLNLFQSNQKPTDNNFSLDGCCPIRIHVTLKKLEGMLSNQNSCYVKEVRRNVVQSEFMLH
jgi:hypothetical protein